MQAELEHIKVAVQQFKKNEVKEKEVVQTVRTFKDMVSKWWPEAPRHDLHRYIQERAVRRPNQSIACGRG
jgi:hypothetical protein